MDHLEGRTAVVTGGGRGIGRAIALELAGAGVRVGLVSRSGDELAETAKRVMELGGEATVIRADLADADGVAEVLRRAGDALGGVDMLINNAAVVWPLEPSAGIDAAAWAAAMTTNVVSAATLTFALLPSMLERGWGRIVNVSSGIVANPGSLVGGNAYVTTKAALEAHSINLAAELDGSGVTVNVFRPGIVDTAMQTWIRGQDPAVIGAGLHERFTRFHADGALITPEASAQALTAHLPGVANGEVWTVTDVPATASETR